METRMFRRPIYFDAPNDAGAGVAPAPAPAAEVAPPVSPETPPAAEAVPAAPDAPPVADAPPDWNTRITEWGGEEAVVNAVELQKALGTPEGIHALFLEAGRALGFGDDRIQALFEPGAPLADAAPPTPGAEAAPTVEELLSDPDRVLTAAELKLVLEHERNQARQQEEAENARVATKQAVDAGLSALNGGKGVEDVDKPLVLTLADRFLTDRFGQPIDVSRATPDQIKAAIERGHAEFQSIVKREADRHLQAVADTHNDLPTPLSGGNPSGGGEAVEPSSLDEASRRVRKALGFE